MAVAADPCNVDVVTTQPQSQFSTTKECGADSKVLYNGEEVIFEAICDAKNLKTKIINASCTTGLRFCKSIAGAPITCIYSCFSVPCGFYCAKRVSNSWRLFLTRSQLHYMRKDECCLCSSTNTDIHLDLSDINKIYVQDAELDTGCCTSSTLPTNVAVEFKPDRQETIVRHIREHACCQSWWCWVFAYQLRGNINNNNIITLSITHCANAEEFVQAVQQQIQL